MLDLDTVRGFVFDIDGTLLHRGPDGRGHPQPGAVAALERIRASGRKLVLFTNASHVPSALVAHGLREDGLAVTDEELLIRRVDPLDRRVALRSPAIRQLRFGALVGAGGGAMGGTRSHWS